MENNWKFKGKDITDEDVPVSAIGFIYIITQISTGKKYIGKKLLQFSKTKTIKGVKKKVKVQSDWKNYWSSSPTLLEYIAEHGTDDFTREILVFCSGKGSLLYAEELALYHVGALESDDWINQNIRSKIFSSWVKPDEAKELRTALNKLP